MLVQDIKMKKLLILALITTGLMAQDCKSLYDSAMKDFKEANGKWEGNSGIASHYSNRGLN